MKHNDHVNLLRPANLGPGGVWADFGAGSGAFTLALRELIGAQGEIFAIDKDRSRLAELEQAYRARFGRPTNSDGQLHLMHADFTRVIGLPLLDGVLMANSLHYFKNKEDVLRQIHPFLKPSGTFLLVEYNVNSGNPWVPYPLSYETFRTLAQPPDFQTRVYSPPFHRVSCENFILQWP